MSSIRLELHFDNNYGIAYFDNVKIALDDYGQSYQYDINADVTNIKDIVYVLEKEQEHNLIILENN